VRPLKASVMEAITGAGGQVTINNIQNTSKSISVSINASTAEAGRAATVSVYGLVMY
jgi:hypothetical protein